MKDPNAFLFFRLKSTLFFFFIDHQAEVGQETRTQKTTAKKKKKTNKKPKCVTGQGLKGDGQCHARHALLFKPQCFFFFSLVFVTKTGGLPSRRGTDSPSTDTERAS